MVIKNKKDIQKLLGILIIIFGLLTLGVSIFHYFNVPTLTYILIIEIVASCLFIIAGIIVSLTKKRNGLLLKGSFLIAASIGVFLSIDEPIVQGSRTLQGAPRPQGLLGLSAMFFVVGVIMFFIGKSKEDNLNASSPEKLYQNGNTETNQ